MFSLEKTVYSFPRYLRGTGVISLHRKGAAQTTVKPKPFEGEPLAHMDHALAGIQKSNQALLARKREEK